MTYQANQALVCEPDPSAADVGPVNLGALDTGSIHASHNLQIAAGRDIVLGEVDIHADHDLKLAAGRDLVAAATSIHAGDDLGVLAGRDIAFNAIAKRTNQLHGSTFTSTTTHHVTDLKAGGNLRVIAGRDLASHGTTLDAGKSLGLAAGRDITLAAVIDHKHVDTHGWHGDTRFHKVTDDDTLRATQLHAGQGISLTAGHDATLVATQIASGHGNVALAAGHDLTLAAGHENHKTVVDTYHHDSGFLSSSTTTTHDVTDNTLAIGAHIKGNNVRLVAGHDLATQGAAVQAGKALNLAAGHDIHLDASHNIYRHQHRRHHTESSFGTDLILGVGDGQLYTKTTDDQQGMQVDTIANGTLLSGDTVRVAANHDLTTEGAQIAATHDLAMVAGHDLVIDAAANTYDRKQQHKHRVDGWQRSGLVSMVGTTKTRQRAKADEVSYTGTVLGSTEGRISLVAGSDVHITGSDVLSQTGIVITGKSVTIDAALGSSDTHHEYSMHRAGVMGGVGGMVGDLANGAVGTYEFAKRTGQIKDKRLQALYAARTAYQAYDLYQGGKAVANKGISGGMGGTGVSLKISLGASTANSHADTHDDVTYGSHIRSQGDIAIAATDGDLNVIGSQIQGNNVALAASHDLNLLSQVEHHTQKQSGAHAGGQIGVSIGETTGIFLSLNGGKRRAHGNGTTHAITTVDADGTLSLIAGHDALLKGAQARGNQILAGIGHNLTLQSEQDTGDFASKQWNAGFTLVYGWSGSGVGFSGHASAGGMDNHYKSVTQVTGLAAGDGGFQIHVGGNTDLKGAVIASQADPSKNFLDTGSLTYSDIQNEAKYDSWSFSVGGGAGKSLSGKSLAGFHPGIGVPQSHDQSSTTRAGIAKGTITIRHGDQNLAGLDRNPDIDAKGLTREFDRQELAKEQEMSQVAGYVGMRTVGLIGQHFTQGYETAQAAKAQAQEKLSTTTDPTKRAQLQQIINGTQAYMEAHQEQYNHWKDGGAYKTVLHGLVGAGTAALGGGNALDGALGATASEAASGAMQQYLADHGINPNSTEGKGLMELASAAIGGAVGQGVGASMALSGEKYNRQLHPTEIAWIKDHAAAFAKQQCGGCKPNEEQVKQATATLSQQALRNVDVLWRMYIPAGEDSRAAEQYLASAHGSFTNEKGKEQALFATEGNQFTRPGMYANTAPVGFYQIYVQPGATRSLAEGVKVETGYVLSRAGRCVSSIDCVGNIAGSLAEGVYNSVKKGAVDLYDHPWASVKSAGWQVAGAFKSGGETWGETAATWGGVGASKLNQLYGKDVSAAQRTLSGVSSAWVLANAVGAGKVIGAIGERAVKGVAKEVVEGSIADARFAASKLAKKSYTSIKDFRSDGLQVTEQIMRSQEAKAMVDAYVNSGVSENRALEFVEERLSSGKSIPTMFHARPDMELIKVVPKHADGSDLIKKYSPYFMTREQYKKLSDMSANEVANYLGLPAEQGVRGSQLGFDVYEMQPKSGNTPLIFESEVAPITQGEYSASGGARQIIVPNRSKWTDPNKHKIGEIKSGH